jgi:hypothetical protein
VNWKKVQAISFLLAECGASTAMTDSRGYTVWDIASDTLELCVRWRSLVDDAKLVPETRSVI